MNRTLKPSRKDEIKAKAELVAEQHRQLKKDYEHRERLRKRRKREREKREAA